MATNVVDLDAVMTQGDAQSGDAQPDQAQAQADVTQPDDGQGGGAQPGESGGTGDQGQRSDRQADGEALDGRRGPANIRDSIKAASEALPEQSEAFKQLGNAYFREQAYRQHFASPQEAGDAKQLIETVGGVEGVSKLQELSRMYEQQDEYLRDGNPEILDDFATDFPEGFAALAPHYLDKLAKASPDAFHAAVGPYAVAMLENAGVGGYLASILNETDPERAAGMVRQLAQWYEQQRSGAAQMLQSPRTNPGAAKLQQQQDELTQQREQLFREGVEAKVTSAVLPEIAKTVEHYAKQYGLNATQKAHFEEVLKQRVVAQMNGDATYKQQVNLRNAAKSRSHDSVASYIASEFNRRLSDTAFAAAKDIYGAARKPAEAGTGVVKAGTPKAAPSGGPLRVSRRPPDSQLDLSRPDADLLMIQGRGYTKDGRFVSWR